MHSPNNRHCQCHSCNHPCAHICKTRKPKGKRWTDEMAHMCHFSSKPHAHMCCGGEDLPSAAQPIMEPGISWKHSEVISSLRTVPTEPHSHRRKSVNMQSHDAEMPKKSPRKLSPSYACDNRTALLERTGSDLSISSLPSSSSVAEVFIGRSVLTDESDIDSETERSLESSSKAGNKQGFRSLVACFLANSLRLKKFDKTKETKASVSQRRKRNKKYSRKDDRLRAKPNKLGLSSTDASYADIPSIVANTQPFNSLSSDIARHANEANIRPTVLYTSPRYASCNSKSLKGLKNSPCRLNEFAQQHHHIDGHISEEVTNSSSSSAQKNISVDRSEPIDMRPSTNASSENTASPRRRRNKGPAPKPPISTTQYSSSPMSTNNVSTSCPSSLPQSPSNSSIVTSSSATSKNQKFVPAKSPVPLPPNLTRSLSEQKQLNLKNRMTAMQTYRSEVNLQDSQQGVEPVTNENDDNIIVVCEPTVTKKAKQHEGISEPIYQTPTSVMALIEDDLPPKLPAKTFNVRRAFGCDYNFQTQRLEKSINSNNESMIRSQSMPFSQYTCCMYHWKQYLSTIAEPSLVVKCDNKKTLPRCSPKCYASNRSESDCDSETEDLIVASELMNALLSPKHSVRFKKSKKQTDFESPRKDSSNFGNGQLEFLRALSDGSLTNSTATVVEFINDEDGEKESGQKQNCNGKNETEEKCPDNSSQNVYNQRCLSDVFCQTNFPEVPEKPPRKYKHHKHSCRCRPLKSRSHNRHCRHHHSCSHYVDCCPSSQNLPFMSANERTCANVWLTSSTSDHSLSSLSSSTSTLSESSTLRTSSVLSNDTSRPQNIRPSISPFGDSIPHFNETDINLFKEDSFTEIIAGRSPISTERLFKSAENSFPTLLDGNNTDFVLFDHDKNPSTYNTDILHRMCLRFLDILSIYCLSITDSSVKSSDKLISPQLWSKESQIKCLMSELELAIATGNHHRASVLAKELAIKRANCTLSGKVSTAKDGGSSPIV